MPDRNRLISLRGVLACVFALLLGGACRAQQTVDVTFAVRTAEPITAGEQVYISGSADTLGGWHPKGLALQRVDSLTWRSTVPMERERDVEFKVTMGSWQREALMPDGSVPDNYLLRARHDTTVRISVVRWKGGDGLQVTGDLRVHENLGAPGLTPRDVTVWLPPGYAEDVDTRYPVLYAHDGQNLFDPDAASFGVDWQLDENADSLITTGRMRATIIVGIHNTAERSSEYHDTDVGESYRAFIIGSLKQLIDTTYRTLPDRANTGVIGSSSGGFAAFLLLWRHPEVFSVAACLSPYFPNTLPRRVEQSGWEASGKRLYIDNGGDDLDTRLQEGVDRMLPALESVGFVRGESLLWRRFPEDGHNESAWAARVWQPLLFMFGTQADD